MQKPKSDLLEFKKLLLASFISQTGSHFLTLALSAFVLVSTGSPIRSGLVFVLSFLPSILVGSSLGHWVDQKISKKMIATNELISIVATVLCGISIAFDLPLIFFSGILAFRSILMFVGRAAATKWLKLITPPELQTPRIKLFYLGFFLSTAVSGLLASFVLKAASIWAIVLIDSVSYLLGIAVYLSLSTISSPTQADVKSLIPEVKSAQPIPSLWQTLRMILAMPQVRTSFLIVCFSQALFQGAYSALVSYLPIRVFGLGVQGIGAYQLAASTGITGGFLLNWLAASLLKETRIERPIRALAISAAALGFLVGCVSPLFPVSLVSFCGLNLAYECVWLYHSSEFFRGSPKCHAARYQFTLSSCAAFLMSLSTLAYSLAVQFLGPAPGVIAVLIGGVGLVSALSLFSRGSLNYDVISGSGENK